MRGALTLPVCAVLGLPLSVASTVPSITHVISLTTYEVKQLPEGERKVPTKVVEQRATNFLIHVFGLSFGIFCNFCHYVLENHNSR